MEDSHKSDQQLLQCPPRVDTSTFPKASANKIAQNFGKYMLYLALREQNLA